MPPGPVEKKRSASAADQVLFQADDAPKPSIRWRTSACSTVAVPLTVVPVNLRLSTHIVLGPARVVPPQMWTITLSISSSSGSVAGVSGMVRWTQPSAVAGMSTPPK